jgi:hypothetical protein
MNEQSISFETLQHGLSVLSQDRTDSIHYENDCLNRMLKAVDDAWNKRVQKTTLFGMPVMVMSHPDMPAGEMIMGQNPRNAIKIEGLV